MTLTLDPGQGHTVVHLSSSTTCIPNFIKIEETFCGRTDGRTDGHLTPILLGRLPNFGYRALGPELIPVYRQSARR